MAKLIGNISWVPQPGYPQLKGKDGSETLTAKYIITKEQLREMPAYGSFFKSPDHPYFTSFSWLTLTEREITAMSGGKTYEVTLVYTDNNTGNELPTTPEAVIQTEYELDTSDYDAPLTQRPKYRTSWDHALAARDDVSAVPAWWQDATDTSILSEYARDYAWIKNGDQAPSGFYILQPPVKKAVAYLAGDSVVTKIERSTSFKRLAAKAELDYTMQTPGMIFNRKGEWLQKGSSLKKEGKYWVLTTRYQNTGIVDKDLYD